MLEYQRVFGEFKITIWKIHPRSSLFVIVSDDFQVDIVLFLDWGIQTESLTSNRVNESQIFHIPQDRRHVGDG